MGSRVGHGLSSVIHRRSLDHQRPHRRRPPEHVERNVRIEDDDRSVGLKSKPGPLQHQRLSPTISAASARSRQASCSEKLSIVSAAASSSSAAWRRAASNNSSATSEPIRSAPSRPGWGSPSRLGTTSPPWRWLAPTSEEEPGQVRLRRRAYHFANECVGRSGHWQESVNSRDFQRICRGLRTFVPRMSPAASCFRTEDSRNSHTGDPLVAGNSSRNPQPLLTAVDGATRWNP